jgi:hypothetical protein
MIVLLLIGAGGSKVVGIPLLAGGLALFLLWSSATRRPIDRAAAGILAISVIVFAVYAAILYSGGGGSGLRFTLGGIYELMPSLTVLETAVPDALPAQIAFWGIGSVATTLLHFGPPLLGLYWILGRGRPPLRPGQALLLCILAAGLPAWFLLRTDTGDNYYFMAYGMFAAFPVVAEGLCRGFAGRPAADAVPRGRALALAWIGLLLALAWVGWEMTLGGHPARAYLLIYGTLALGLLGLLGHAWRAPPARRAGAIALLALAILLPAGLDLMLDSVPTSARKLVQGEPLYNDGRGGYGLTPGVIEAARWARDETDEDAVLAISNQRSVAGAEIAPLRAEFPAFSERRAFLEGWAYSRDGLPFRAVVERRVHPYPERRRLETRVFERGDEEALRTMTDLYGVTHLVVDLRDGPVRRRVNSMGRVVFSNASVDIIELP